MGTYTEHWKSYLRESKKNAIRLVLFVVIGLPGTAALPYLVSLVTGEYPVLIQLALLALWLTVFTLGVVRSTRITCPRCVTVYGQSKWQRSCPSCGLKILQDEP